MTKPFKVDFIGIGSGKCGSTWLYDNVVKHPQIYRGNLKELNYFSDLYDEHPYSWYESQFAGCEAGTLKGEFSVTYLAHPLAAERIKHHLPDVKLIAIIRNPVDRTYSNYLHSLRKGDVSPSLPFARYIEDERHLAPARYAAHLRVWLERFPRQQLLVLLLEEFVEDLPAGYRETFRFLGVDKPDFLPPGYASKRNEARLYRHLWLENLLVQSYRWLSRKGYTRLVKKITETQLADVIRSLNQSSAEPPRLDESSRQRLHEYFQPLNAELSDLLQKDLSVWNRPARPLASPRPQQLVAEPS
jgi:hypothetical protein